MTAPLFGQNSSFSPAPAIPDYEIRAGPHCLMTYSDIARCWYKCVADMASEACFYQPFWQSNNHIVR
jgi:hypothetical protein